MTIYLIDGVRVPLRVYKARQIWGEYSGAEFTYYVEEKILDPRF